MLAVLAVLTGWLTLPKCSPEDAARRTGGAEDGRAREVAELVGLVLVGGVAGDVGCGCSSC